MWGIFSYSKFEADFLINIAPSKFSFYLILWNVHYCFLSSHWEKYNTGILFLPWGYDVSQVVSLRILNRLHSEMPSSVTVLRNTTISRSSFPVALTRAACHKLQNRESLKAPGKITTSFFFAVPHSHLPVDVLQFAWVLEIYVVRHAFGCIHGDCITHWSRGTVSAG